MVGGGGGRHGERGGRSECADGDNKDGFLCGGRGEKGGERTSRGVGAVSRGSRPSVKISTGDAAAEQRRGRVERRGSADRRSGGAAVWWPSSTQSVHARAPRNRQLGHVRAGLAIGAANGGLMASRAEMECLTCQPQGADLGFR